MGLEQMEPPAPMGSVPQGQCSEHCHRVKGPASLQHTAGPFKDAQHGGPASRGSSQDLGWEAHHGSRLQLEGRAQKNEQITATANPRPRPHPGPTSSCHQHPAREVSGYRAVPGAHVSDPGAQQFFLWTKKAVPENLTLCRHGVILY